MKEMAELNPLPDELRALVDAERRRDEPPDAVRDRVLLRLGATVGLGVPLGHAASAAAQTGRGAAFGRVAHLGRAANLARAAAIFVAGAASGAGGYRAVEHVRAKSARSASHVTHALQPVPPAMSAPLPDVVPSPPVAPPSEAEETPTSRRRRTAAAAVRAAPAERDDDRLGPERALLEIAREALVRGQSDGALAALARHEATFPQGQLAEERDGLFVQALVAARHYDEARARAAEFSRKYPRSLFSPGVTQALESIP